MKQFDVAIAGSGIAGTTLASILARHGVSVLLIELGKHPRFALGEAMLPQSAIWPFILGETFEVPEIRHLSHADRIVDHITPACGIKHSIGFAYHQQGQAPRADTLHQLIPPHLPFYSESHLMREDVDAYLLDVAKKYGCEYVDETRITHVDTDPDQITIHTNRGDYSAAYFVDASGRGSQLAQQQGYRDDAPKAATHSRCIFAHVEGLKPYDALLDVGPGQSRRLHDGTLHHVFDGGWIWIIPFDNFARSASGTVSVGLMLDSRRFPVRDDLSPEDEFREFILRYPAIDNHLSGIRALRPFIRTGRLQYSASRAVGHRHFLTNNTYGFVDALYSNGLINTFETVFFGASLLLSAFGKRPGPVSEGDFSAAAFAPIERLQQAQWHQADRLVSNAYKAMASFETWNAWTQLWLGQILFHDLWLQRACFQYFSTGDRERFAEFLTEERPGMDAPFVAEKLSLLAAVEKQLDDFSAGKISAEVASEEILTQLREQAWLPHHVYNWGDRSARHVDFAQAAVVGRLLEWGFTASPSNLRKGLFDFELPPMG